MKKRTKVIIGLACLCATCGILAGCTSGDDYYSKFKESGNEVKIRYDSNGGRFASTDNTTLVDVYPTVKAQSGVKLLEPGSPERGSKTTLSTASRSGYFLAGWYKTRTLRADASGNALDEDGNLCSASGKEQGYVYDGKWDFSSTYRFTDGDAQAEDGYAMTLYAAWIPNFSYAFMEENESGEWRQYGRLEYNPLLTTAIKQIPMPVMDADNVGMEYDQNFLQSEGKTFVAAYMDASKQNAVEGSFVHPGVVDYAKGVAVNGIANVYTSWKKGIWFNIYTAEQLSNHARIDGCYVIYNDLDFTGVTWSAGFESGAFSGQILSAEGIHKISNVKALQIDTSLTQMYGGLFGRLQTGAVIKGISFENVSYTVAQGARVGTPSYGLLTGNLSEGAVIENVTIQGKLSIGNIYRNSMYEGYSIGLLCGNYSVTKGISFADIECEIDETAFPSAIPFTLNVNRTTGEVKLVRT